MKLTVRKTDFLKHQWAFLTGKESIKALVAGYGSGKTFVFLRQTLINHITRKHPATGLSNGWIIYPTYDLADELFVDPFLNLLEKYHIRYNYNRQKHILTTVYGRIKVFQLQRPKRIVGSELTYIGFDEFDIESWNNCKTAFEKALGRLRGAENVSLYFVTTPEGLHYTYKIFVTDNDGSRLIVHADSRDNPYLPKGYIELLQANYPPKLLEAYLSGKFVNLTEGSLYFEFDREKHMKDLETDRNSSLILSCDFNKAPMAWVVGQTILGRDGRINIKVVDEIHIKTNAKTIQAAREFAKRYKSHTRKFVIVHGDASGHVTDHRDYTTDYKIIEETLISAGWKVKLDVPRMNPGINNRVNLVNTAFYRGNLLIDKKCINLAHDLENVTEKDGAKDKSNADLTHFSDALDYFVVKYFSDSFKTKVSQL